MTSVPIIRCWWLPAFRKIRDFQTRGENTPGGQTEFITPQKSPHPLNKAIKGKKSIATVDFYIPLAY